MPHLPHYYWIWERCHRVRRLSGHNPAPEGYDAKLLCPRSTELLLTAHVSISSKFTLKTIRYSPFHIIMERSSGKAEGAWDYYDPSRNFVYDYQTNGYTFPAENPVPDSPEPATWSYESHANHAQASAIPEEINMSGSPPSWASSTLAMPWDEASSQ